MSNLATAWTKSERDPDQRQKMEDLIRNSTTVLGRLKALLEEDERNILISQVQEPDNDSSWALKQAHQNGQLMQIRKTLNLLSFF